MFIRRIAQFCRNRSAAAGAEMALVTPLLLIIMFGAFDTGNYFLTQHVVTVAVRDGARFAGRQPSSAVDCDSVDTAALTEIRNVVRFGKPVVTDSDEPRLGNWDEETIAVTVDCPPIGTYSGIYAGRTDAPRVTVSVGTAEDFEYGSLFGFFGLPATLKLGAQATSPLIGM